MVGFLIARIRSLMPASSPNGSISPFSRGRLYNPPKKAFWKVKTALQCAGQYISSPECAIIGSYHGQNVGDLALGGAVLNVAQDLGLHAGMQNLGLGEDGLQKWPEAPYAVLGGGALGNEDRLSSVRVRYGESPEAVAMIGLDFDPKHAFSDSTLQFLENVARITCRSRVGVQRLQKLLNRDDVRHAPDNAFCLPCHESLADETTKENRTVGLNTVSLYYSVNPVSGRYDMGFDKSGEISDDHARRSSLMSHYVELIRKFVKQMARRGFEIVHIPFTYDDELFARQTMKGLSVSQYSYTTKLETVARRVRSCDLFLGTRYHAHVFALANCVPFLSVQYARKCEEMQDDLGIPGDCVVDKETLTTDPQTCLEKVLTSDGFVLSPEDASSIHKRTRRNIEDSLGAIVPAVTL